MKSYKRGLFGAFILGEIGGLFSCSQLLPGYALPSTTCGNSFLFPRVHLPEPQEGTPEEILELAKEEGYELSDAELESVSGGDWDCWTVCTGRCGRYNDCPHDRF